MGVIDTSFLMNGFKEVLSNLDYEDEHIGVGSLLMHRHLINEKIQISKRKLLEEESKVNYSLKDHQTFSPLEKMSVSIYL